MKLKTHTFTFVTLLMSAVALPAVAATDHADFFGDAAPSSAATQEKRIDPTTGYVNVTGGDIVKFDIGGKTFTWDFDVAQSIGSFDLNKVAPPGMLDHPVTVYIAPDPRYLGA